MLALRHLRDHVQRSSEPATASGRRGNGCTTSSDGRKRLGRRSPTNNNNINTAFNNKVNPTTEQTSEVIDLSPPNEWLYKCDCPKCISGAHYDKDIAESYRKRGELNNEVARLRELLIKAIDNCECEQKCSSNFAGHCDCGRYRRNDEINDELARLAPASEETQDGATMDQWYGGFAKIESTAPVTEKDTIISVKEPATDWRVVGYDEVIQEGDDLFYEPNGGSWEECDEIYWGLTAGKMTNYRFRTRRPLPVVVDQTQSKWFKASAAKAEAKEMKPEITNRSQESHSVKWGSANPPLEKEFEYLTKEASRAADIHTHVVIVDCLRYLRDEIQKLKEAR